MSEAVDRLMQRYQGAVPGASVLVVRNGETLVLRSYGVADLEQGIATTPSTNYRLASVTKQFTAAAVLMLAEDSRLGLDDAVRRWLPSLHPAADAVSIRHLLTHTSGLVDYEDVIPATATAQLRDADVLRLLAPQNRLYFPPGGGYRYSNSGYALLALIVERASGRAFSNFLRERIFLPAGMDGSLVQVPHGPTVQHRAYGYSELDAGWARTDQDRTSAVLGDGGIYSSVQDLARWDAALYGNGLLGAASRRLAFSPATATDVRGIQYGYGWRISGDSVWHSGETIGFRNVIVRHPRQRLSVVILSNRNAPEPYATAKAIAARFMAR
ncbi:serine hydrolase domain-containing protein [Lysobacter sp. D1-1-M9]|uniref:serine hydrolase domain-containing protein n=1 Tax=Novilysobacter longmucuonensis TaxID=3098603 RepID=UPI002FCAE632